MKEKFELGNLAMLQITESGFIFNQIHYGIKDLFIDFKQNKVFLWINYDDIGLVERIKQLSKKKNSH